MEDAFSSVFKNLNIEIDHFTDAHYDGKLLDSTKLFSLGACNTWSCLHHLETVQGSLTTSKLRIRIVRFSGKWKTYLKHF